MRNKSLTLVALILCLSTVSGYMFSKMSWLGRVGVKYIHTQYAFMRIWWQASAVVFTVLLLLMAIHYLVQKHVAKANLVHISAIALAFIGLYFTYRDFRETLSHRWLGERFHIGAYCFWIGWMCISIFYLSRKKITGVDRNL